MILLQEFEMPFLTVEAAIKNRRYGIEVEVERCNVHINTEAQDYWNATGDSSLKEQGVEYVSRILLKEEIPLALRALYRGNSTLRDKEATFGPRTSIHVHSDFMWAESGHDIMTMLFGYLLVEDLMYAYVAPHRRKNIFCVKTKETKYLRDTFSLNTFGAGNLYKYSGFNLLSIFTHGTIEFRMLEGTYDQQKIIQWVEFIDTISTFARNMRQGILFKREVKNPEFARSLFYPAFSEMFSEEDIEKSIQSGLEYFRYLVCDTVTSKHVSAFTDPNFLQSKFYTNNFVRTPS
jgi:hypothetical protein